MPRLYIKIYLLIICLVFVYISYPVLADTSKSTNFQLQEPSVGGTGNLNAQSANFQSTGTAAVLGLGTSTSGSFQINNGHVTTPEPTLSFSVDTPSVSFGTFSAATTTTATAVFEVLNYTSYGYVVQTLGNPPKYNTHTVNAMSSTLPSQTGIEQFGINLVANTSPASFGANPDHGDFGVGSASANYNSPNNYRFVSGETIASAPKSSGLTIYTVSYIVNVSSLTPGGEYAGDQTILCIGTY
jgi:hypothetical protein